MTVIISAEPYLTSSSVAQQLSPFVRHTSCNPFHYEVNDGRPTESDRRSAAARFQYGEGSGPVENRRRADDRCATFLSEHAAGEAGEQVDEDLTKAEASKRIDELQEKTGRGK